MALWFEELKVKKKKKRNLFSQRVESLRRQNRQIKKKKNREQRENGKRRANSMDQQ